MDDAWVEWVGLFAGVLTTISFLPQVFQVLKTRSTSSISLGMYVIFCSGGLVWAVYGLLKGAWSIILTEAVTFVLACSVLGLKLKWRD